MKNIKKFQDYINEKNQDSKKETMSEKSIKENLEGDINYEIIANEIEKGNTNGLEPIEWDLEVNIQDWIKLDDEDIDMIATQIRNGELSGNDPIDWSLEFGEDDEHFDNTEEDNFDNTEEEEEVYDEDDDDSEDNDVNEFYIKVEDGSKTGIVRVFLNRSGKWSESLYSGDEIYGLGKNYQSYLKPSDILQWFKKDFDDAKIISDEEAEFFKNDYDLSSNTEEEEEYNKKSNIQRFESFNREDIANHLGIDKDEFEDSSDLGDMADSISDSNDSYEFAKMDAEELFDAYKDNNDMSQYFTPTISNDFEYNKEESLFNAIIKYYDADFENEHGYIEDFGSELFDMALKDLIKKFLKNRK